MIVFYISAHLVALHNLACAVNAFLVMSDGNVLSSILSSVMPHKLALLIDIVTKVFGADSPLYLVKAFKL